MQEMVVVRQNIKIKTTRCECRVMQLVHKAVDLKNQIPLTNSEVSGSDPVQVSTHTKLYCIMFSCLMNTSFPRDLNKILYQFQGGSWVASRIIGQKNIQASIQTSKFLDSYLRKWIQTRKKNLQSHCAEKNWKHSEFFYCEMPTNSKIKSFSTGPHLIA